MTTGTPTALLKSETTTNLKPGYEGSNIGSWIGFKHINYLAADAVLEHLRTAGFSVRSLYEQYGLCLEIVDLDTRINTAFHLDDLVEATVTPGSADRDGELLLKVSLRLGRECGPRNAALSTVRMQLRRDGYGGTSEATPPELRSFAVGRIRRSNAFSTPIPLLPAELVSDHEPDQLMAELSGGGNTFVLRSRIPYPYCHFTERMKMSGYLRHMEQVVDLFLADRGVSIKHLLNEQNWIPVVPRSHISILDEAIMEENMYTVLAVERIFKRFTFAARMDTYVLRGGELLRTAAGRITHGYAAIASRSEFSLVEFDDRLITALGGE
jgi:acyl-CoA thioesterase FadM